MTAIMNIDNLETAPEAEILAAIGELQAIQKAHYWKQPAWQVADELLEPLFAEMASRQQGAA